MTTQSVMHLYMRTGQAPEVGKGGTVLLYSDSYPVTIVGVYGKRAEVREDKVTVVGGEWPDLKYRYDPDSDAPREIFTLRTSGAWIRKGESIRGGARLMIGPRQYYRDPTF